MPYAKDITICRLQHFIQPILPELLTSSLDFTETVLLERPDPADQTEEADYFLVTTATNEESHGNEISGNTEDQNNNKIKAADFDTNIPSPIVAAHYAMMQIALN
jgi:hypothetical protein